jgi:hypothetical protein
MRIFVSLLANVIAPLHDNYLIICSLAIIIYRNVDVLHVPLPLLIKQGNFLCYIFGWIVHYAFLVVIYYAF